MPPRLVLLAVSFALLSAAAVARLDALTTPSEAFANHDKALNMSQRIDRFTRWLRLDDGGGWIGSLQLRESSTHGLGVFTTKAIPPGGALLAVPLHRGLSWESARRSKIGAPILRTGAAANDTDVGVALQLLYELEVVGPRSAFWPWLALLPPTPPCGALFGAAAIAALQASSAAGFQRTILERWRAEHAAAVPPLAAIAPELFPARSFRFDRYAWARCIVWSRAVDVPVPAAPPAGGAGDARRGVGAGAPGTAAAGTAAGGAAGGGGRAAEGAADEYLRVVVPFLDFINHSPRHAAAPGWDAEHAAVALATASAFRPGDEVLTRYAAKPSQYYFLQYGFVPEPNDHACREVAMPPSASDPQRGRKEVLLGMHGLGSRERNFCFLQGRIDPDLLAAVRIATLRGSDAAGRRGLRLAAAAAGGRRLSAASDAVARARILHAISDLLDQYPTTIEEDEQWLAEHPADGPGGGGGGGGGDGGGGGSSGGARGGAHAAQGPPAAGAARAGAAAPLAAAALSGAAEPGAGAEAARQLRWAVALRAEEKRLLLSSAAAYLKELPADGARGVCKEAYADDVDACIARAIGSAFGMRVPLQMDSAKKGKAGPQAVSVTAVYEL